MKRGKFARGEVIFNGTFDPERQLIRSEDGREYGVDEMRFLPPCRPSKILCVGANYRDALEARNIAPPLEPLIRVMKPASCLIGHKEEVVKPSWANTLFFEGELALVIARRCRNVRAANAVDVIDGYTVFNDFGVRDSTPASSTSLPFAQLIKWKASDTFGPVGPWIEDDIDPSNLKIRTYVDDVVRQDSTTANMVFDIPYLVEYITSFITLEAGDLISTGTPAGAAAVSAGSAVRVEIEGVGALENPVAAGK